MPLRHAPCPDRQGARLGRLQWAVARWLAPVVVCLVVASGLGTTSATATVTAAVTSASSLPALPSGWPTTLQLGSADSPGGAAALRTIAPFGFRYQYLSGGVNTGSGWATWNTDGQFVTYYDQESQAAGIIPVFSYYQLLQSAPGNTQSEPASDFTNLANTATMTSYYQDLTLFFQRAAGTSPVVLQVEPDLWAYMQQAAQNNNASTVPVQVAATGLSALAGLPNTAAGFAQAIVRLRNTYAPNVILGYHFSNWGTGTSILYSKPPNATVQALGVSTGQFYKSLGANFDIAFTDIADRDSGYSQLVNGDGGASWYSAADYARSALYISAFVQTAAKRVVIWQIPLGNTKMRAENNTRDHYQDNKVESLLDDPTRADLEAYANAGVVAFLFGRGADGNTCACDAAGDGVTNPAPIDSNTGVSVSADDDGGFFDEMAVAYYNAGALPLTAPPAPALTAVSPLSGPVSGGTTVTITGTNFAGATKVVFGVVAATSFTVVSNSKITAVSPPQAAELHNIYVTTPRGTSAQTSRDQFTYVG